MDFNQFATYFAVMLGMSVACSIAMFVVSESLEKLKKRWMK